MEYTKKSVRSRPGLSQEDALASLQDHPLYRPGTKIASIRRRGDRWVADLLEPKTAGELEDESSDESTGEESAPPAEKKPKKPAFADDGDDEGPEADGPPESGEGGDGGPSDGPPSEGHDKGGEKGEISSLLHLVQQIADALGIAPAPAMGMGGPDDLGPGPAGPGGPPAPPHGAPPHHPGGGLPPTGPPPPGAAGIGAKLKPGEVPNKPGTVPVGAPAFASRQAMDGSSVQVPIPTPQQPGPAASTGCPHGYPSSAQCPQCQAQSGMQAGAPGAGMNPVVGRVRSFTASQKTRASIAQAKASLDYAYGNHGYRVAQIRRDGDFIRALLVR